MSSNWLYDQSALWVVAVLLAAMLLAFELAYRIARTWHSETHSAGREGFVAIKVSLLGLLALQIALGIATLLMVVPLHLAAAHQAGALLVFAAALNVAHALTPVADRA